MQIIIPMAGIGKRFKDKGYNISKYLLKIEGKTIIEKIIGNFDIKNDNFLFISNKNEILERTLKEIFSKINIKYRLISIKNHRLGPVYTLIQAEKYIKEEEEVIINYCDFYWKWDYDDFKSSIKNYDGGIVCYKGFHPHLLRPNLYAGVKTNNNNEFIEIKEKFSYTENKMDTWQSSGTYYFKSGKILKKYITDIVQKDIKCNGEFYVSLLYNLLSHNGLKSLIYEIHYFLQLGTPDDYEEYKYWEDIFNPTNEHIFFKP